MYMVHHPFSLYNSILIVLTKVCAVGGDGEEDEDGGEVDPPHHGHSFAKLVNLK